MRLLRAAGRIAPASLLVLCLAAAWCGAASGQDLSAAVVDAESRVEAVHGELAGLEAAVTPKEERFAASARRAAPVAAAARGARRDAAKLERRLRARHLAAVARVSQLEQERQDAADKHDEEVRSGIGFGLAMLVAAAIVFAWDRFRVSAPVAALTRISLGQAIGLCVGVGLLMMIVGAAVAGAGGVAGALGVALVVLGFVLPSVFVVARRSVEVQEGRSKPVLRRERWPRRATQVIAGVLAFLFLLGLGSAVFAGEDETSQASAALREEARSEPNTPALLRATERAEQLEERASGLVAAARADRAALRVARRQLGRAESRLARAEADVASYTHRLAAVTAREEREAAAEARRAEERAEEEAEEQEEAAAEECDPNYSGCLDPYASDYDCEGGSGDGPLYTGTVEVLGVDHYGLDEDSDGIGCE
ncbi:MAG TPA: hypothetical protein VFI17_07540 [Solirubrobacterales bacterium]|nr:hypothetical protein [Solirubrobacterales bacterium]